MTGVFTPHYYKLDVLSPVFIGGKKEDDYILGQDFFIDNHQFHFVYKRAFEKSLTPEDISKYTSAIIKNNTNEAASILYETVRKIQN